MACLLFKKITTKVSIMIKREKTKKVTCRLHVLLLCVKLRICSQKSTKQRVEVTRELPLAIHERQWFSGILLQVQVRGALLPVCQILYWGWWGRASQIWNL